MNFKTNDKKQAFSSSGKPPIRGYETLIKDSTLIMRFKTNKDAVSFFEWVMENTQHGK